MEIMEEVDINHNQRIDYREFMAVEAGRELFGNRKKQDKNFNLIVQSFNFFDQDNDGKISSEDLK